MSLDQIDIADWKLISRSLKNFVNPLEHLILIVMFEKVCIFEKSARTPSDDPEYILTEQFARGYDKT